MINFIIFSSFFLYTLNTSFHILNNMSLKSKAIAFSILLLAFCLIGSVCAADNTTDGDITDEIQVSFPEKVYKEDMGEIDVEIPENVSGNLKATINYVEFYNENVTGSVKVPISIPKGAFPIYVVNKITDHTTYGLYLFFNGLEVKSNHTLKVMNYPQNFTSPGFASEILKDDKDEHVYLFFPESANGGAEIYIDGEFSHMVNTSTFTFLNASKFTELALGNHSVGIKYLGDDYYYPFYKNFTFEVVDMLISIPKNMILDHDDCISARILNNTDGIATVYVDNQPVFKDKLDSRGEFLHSMFDDITCGIHQIEFRYVAGNFTKSKKVTANVTYDADIWGWDCRYGDQNTIEIVVPYDFDKNAVKIKINDREYKNFKIDGSGWIDLDISDLEPGNYTAYVDLLAGKKYYSMSLTYNFTVRPGNIRMVNVNALYSQNAQVKVYINDELAFYRDVTINVAGKTYKVKTDYDGTAIVKTSYLKPGKYAITASVGKMKSSSKTLTVKHLVSLNTLKIKKSAKKVTLKAKLAKKLKNKVIRFKFNGKTYLSITDSNGVAKVTFKVKNLKAGKKITYQASYVKDTVKKTVTVKK